MKRLILFAFFIGACAQKSHLNKSSSPESNAISTPVESYISPVAARGIDYSTKLESIAFGSCANQDQPQPIWNTIAAANPEMFIFMGDNIYASSSSQKPIAEQYRKLDLISDYRSLREKIPFLATWDDHDFGFRDGGTDWQGKDKAQKDFLNYWIYVKNSIPLEQGGIYHSKIIGPKKQTVQIIMLDTRYFRSPLKEKPGQEGTAMDYEPQEEGTLLGETQWGWLEEQLKRPAKIRFIVTSIQLIANEPKFEKWDNFPKERQRFFDLLRKTKAKNVIILSGDRHIASIASLPLKNYGTLHEVTSSSLNRPNNYDDKDPHYLGPVYNQENFGLAKIDWKKNIVTAEIRNLKNTVVNSVEIKLK